MYEADDKMISIIADNYDTLQSLGRFGINLGFGDKNIPYTKEMFVACEMTEGLKHFVPINQQIASRIATFLTEPLNIPAKDIVKVVTSK